MRIFSATIIVFFTLMHIGTSVSIKAAEEMESDPLFFQRPLIENNRENFSIQIYGSSTTIEDHRLAPTIDLIHASVLEWFQESVFQNKREFSGNIKKIFWGVGAFSGLGRSTISFKLSYDFLSRYTSSQMADFAFGLTSAIPVAMLGFRLINKTIQKLAEKEINSEEIIKIPQKKFIKHIKNGSILLAGLISAAPLTYLCYSELNDTISWGWIFPGITTFYTRTATDYYSINTIISTLRDEINILINKYYAQKIVNLDSSSDADILEHEERAMHLVNIIEQSENSYWFINSLSNDQAKTIKHELTNREFTEEKMKILLRPNLLFTEDEINIEKNGWTEKTIGLIGGLVGSYGMWVFFPVAREAFIPVFSLLKIENSKILLDCFAGVSTTTASSLAAVATASSSIKYYHALSQGTSFLKESLGSLCGFQWSHPSHTSSLLNTKRISAAVLAALLASCNATMQAQVAYEYTDTSNIWSQLEMGAAVFASFSVCYWAVDELILDFLKASRPHASLLNMINQTLNNVSSFSTSTLRIIDNILFGEENIINPIQIGVPHV